MFDIVRIAREWNFLHLYELCLVGPDNHDFLQEDSVELPRNRVRLRALSERVRRSHHIDG